MSGVLGAWPVGIVEPARAIALDLLMLPQSALSDAVMLIEVSATDGMLTATGGALTLGADPVGIMPGGITGGSVLLDWSDRDWTSSPTDARPNVHFEGRAADISLERSIPLRPDADRRVAAALSDIVLDNSDGEFDDFGRLLAVDGRPVTVSLLASRAASYASRQALFSGVGRSWRPEAAGLRLLSASQGYLMDVPMLGLYAGAGGASGGADLKGKPIPELWGLCRGFSPPGVDTALLIYQVSAREISALTGVYVRGAPVTYGTLRADYATLAATPPGAGIWDWCVTPGGSYIRLGSTPDGAVTVDAQGDASAGYSASTAGMLRRLLARGGGTLNASAFDSLAAILPGDAGFAFADQVSFAEAASRIAGGAACWWGDVGDGLLSAGRLAAPSASSGVLLDQESILGDVVQTEAPPVLWRVTVRYRRNWTPLSASDVVVPPTITEARRQELMEPYRIAFVADVARRARHALALEMTIDSALDQEADALALGNNLLSLFAPSRRAFRVPMGLAGYGLALGGQARLVWPRFGLASGLDVRVIGHSARGRGCDVMVVG